MIAKAENTAPTAIMKAALAAQHLKESVADNAAAGQAAPLDAAHAADVEAVFADIPPQTDVAAAILYKRPGSGNGIGGDVRSVMSDFGFC